MTRTPPPTRGPDRDPTPRRGRTDGPGPCVPPADLTAFVLGEGDDATRGRVARHVFACEACRARRDAELDLVGRLEAFADLGAWEEDLAAADRTRRTTARARRRGVLAGAVAAVALAAATVGLPFGTRGPAADEAATSVAAEASPPAAAPRHAAPPSAGTAALLAAQGADGRWHATTGSSRHDVGVTGLALLALVRTSDSPWTSGPVARAVASAVRWLAPRADDVDGAGDRERAVAVAALEAVHAATGDRSVGAAADRARRTLPPGLATAAEAGAAGAPDAAQALAFVRPAPRELAAAR